MLGELLPRPAHKAIVIPTKQAVELYKTEKRTAMTDSFNAHQDGDFTEKWQEVASNMCLEDWADELAQVCSELREDATEPKHEWSMATPEFEWIMGAIVAAEKSAREGHGPAAMKHLSNVKHERLLCAIRGGHYLTRAALAHIWGRFEEGPELTDEDEAILDGAWASVAENQQKSAPQNDFDLSQPKKRKNMLHDKPVRILMRDMVQEMQVAQSQVITRQQVEEWFTQRYPDVKNGTIAGHLTRMSTNAPSRLHHSLQSDGSDDLFFKIDATHYRLYAPLTDPTPITGSTVPPDADEVAPQGSGSDLAGTDSQFAYEHDLRDFLAVNLSHIEPGLKLYKVEGISGVEFPVGGRYVDILALDQNGDYVVIELKVSKGYDRVVGQTLRYISWIEKYQADAGQQVRGIIVAKTISEDLRLACSKLPYVKLFEYSLSVSLTAIETILP